jgi:hypothetical protein
MTVAVDRYISDLSSRLHVGARTRVRIQAEVRDHLDDATAQQIATGTATDVAAEQAVADFGSASDLATQFNVETGTQAMRRAPLIVLAAGVAVFGGFLLAVTTQPHARASTNARPVVRSRSSQPWWRFRLPSWQVHARRPESPPSREAGVSTPITAASYSAARRLPSAHWRSPQPGGRRQSASRSIL